MSTSPAGPQTSEALRWQCACCGSAESRPLAYHDQFLDKALLECATCGHIQVARMPGAAELQAYYSETYSERRRSYVGPAYMRVMARRARAQLAFMERRCALRDRNFVDVGCGFGALLLAARARGARTIGLEFDPHVAETCRAQGLDVKLVASEAGLIDRIREAKPDIVAMSHILEHLRDPAAVLRACSTALIFVEVPRYRADVAEQFVDQEGHLHFFGASSLAHLLRRQRLSALELQVCGPKLEGFWQGNRSWGYRLRRFLVRDPFLRQYATPREDGLWIRALARCVDDQPTAS